MDLEKTVTPRQFAKTLRRIADAVERGGSFRIQIHGQRLTIPRAHTLSIEHEVEDGDAELELQVSWTVEDDGAKNDDAR